MDKSTAGTLVAGIAVSIVAAASTILLVCARHSDGWIDAVSKRETHGLQKALSGGEAELAEITNGITCAFHKKDKTQSYVFPCASKTLKYVTRMTNDTLRLAVSRHLAGEVLHLNLTNENYHLRWQHIDDVVDSIRYADRCLFAADAPEMERCRFFFDALQRVKEGFQVTLAEPPTKPTDLDRYGRGALWAQGNCKHRVRDHLASTPGYLNNAEFRRMYPKLSPKTKEYFRMRFKEVFGIGYIPDEPGKKAYLTGEKGTMWDGKGLKWRICDENNDWHDVVTED